MNFCTWLYGRGLKRKKAKFDAASVKPNLPDDRIVSIDSGPGGRFAARGYTLKLLIQYAYDVKGWQISGGPAWMDVDRFDVMARGAGSATPAQLRQMLQALLADRFALRLHPTEREMAGFELTIARGGPKIKRSSVTVVLMSRSRWSIRRASRVSTNSKSSGPSARIRFPIPQRSLACRFLKRCLINRG